jgi:glycosyltransferase involved in cell wall biosynthesis
VGLKVGFDATPLLGQRTGVGNYTSRLLAALIRTRPEWEFLLYSNRPIEPLEPGLLRSTPIYQPSLRKRLLWMHFVLPTVIRRSQPQLCHFPNAMAPLRQQKPFVLTIHDASLFLHSNYHPLARLLSIRLSLPYLARHASAIVTDSNDARDDLIRILKLPPAKVHVIYGAASSEFKPEAIQSRKDALRSKYGLPDQYLIFVGTLESRKNLVRLVRAVDQVRNAGFTHRLVIAGAAGWMSGRLYEEIDRLDLKDWVKIVGYVPDMDLPGLLSMSTLFVFPSLFEGFGLPTLEAMSCGTPVLTSDESSMPEVCGDAAHYVDPEDEASIAEGIMTVLRDEEYRQELSRRGLERAKLFSWDRAARETIDIYQKVLNSAN